MRSSPNSVFGPLNGDNGLHVHNFSLFAKSSNTVLFFPPYVSHTFIAAVSSVNIPSIASPTFTHLFKEIHSFLGVPSGFFCSKHSSLVLCPDELASSLPSSVPPITWHVPASVHVFSVAGASSPAGILNQHFDRN